MPKKKKQVAETESSTDLPMANPKKDVFPVIGLGASAGGVRALKDFFSSVEEDYGMAYIVINHLPPGQPDHLAQLLQSVTPLPVSLAVDGQEIVKNHIYVYQPDTLVEIKGKKLQVTEVYEETVFRPIDHFFRSLAVEQAGNGAAVILSGTGTDGSRGVVEVNGNDGLVIVQTMESAEHEGMPRSAVVTGVVDMVLPPEQMSRALHSYFTHHRMTTGKVSANEVAAGNKEWLNSLFAILAMQVGHDFSGYKINTVLRRINRRMSLQQIISYEQYVNFLRDNPNETYELFNELLIGVTHFFRDNESFESLKENGFPGLFAGLDVGDTFRAWIPGCSTGEEVYSLAILLSEYLDNNPKRIAFQLFGTDIDKHAIEKARDGIYPPSIADEVSEERLQRFFTQEGEYYRIRKCIRDRIVFAEQDILKDPPFSRLHLLCCRNLLIYLNGESQKKLMPLFHFTLKENGLLMLSSSETIGGFGNMFVTVDQKWKIFRRQSLPENHRRKVEFPNGPIRSEKPVKSTPVPPVDEKVDIGQLVKETLLENHSPAALLVDEKGDILHIQGRTGRYLEGTSGPFSRNIIDLAREGLQMELATALEAAKKSKKPIERKNIHIDSGESRQLVDMHITALKQPKALAGRYLVVFRDVEQAEMTGASGKSQHARLAEENRQIRLMEKELQRTRENLQTSIEELESSNEELKSTNEELQSSNEELQSTNEELESSKEELQSLNEELHTVNAELESKFVEVTAAHDDMRNLLDCTGIATIFIDNDQRVRRFTPEATELINLIQTDIGRPLKHVVTNLKYQGLFMDLDEVSKSLVPIEKEIQTVHNSWYKMRIFPYRTMENRIDGAVLTFIDMNEQKKVQAALGRTRQELELTRQLLREVAELSQEPLLVVDPEGTIVHVNQTYLQLTAQQEDEVVGQSVENMHPAIGGDDNSTPVELTTSSEIIDNPKQNKVSSKWNFEQLGFRPGGWNVRESEVADWRLLCFVQDK